MAEAEQKLTVGTHRRKNLVPSSLVTKPYALKQHQLIRALLRKVAFAGRSAAAILLLLYYYYYYYYYYYDYY